MTTNTTPGPLNFENLRRIVRDHAAFVAACVDTAPSYELSAEEVSSTAAYVLLEKPEISDTIVAEGCGCTAEEARQLGIFKRALLITRILELTQAEISPEAILTIVKEEVAPWSALMTGTRH